MGLTRGSGRPRLSQAGFLCLLALHLRQLHLALALLADSRGCGLGGAWGRMCVALALTDTAAPAFLVVGRGALRWPGRVGALASHPPLGQLEALRDCGAEGAAV